MVLPGSLKPAHVPGQTHQISRHLHPRPAPHPALHLLPGLGGLQGPRLGVRLLIVIDLHLELVALVVEPEQVVVQLEEGQTGLVTEQSTQEGDPALNAPGLEGGSDLGPVMAW